MRASFNLELDNVKCPESYVCIHPHLRFCVNKIRYFIPAPSEELPKKLILRINTEPVDGWYKCETSKGGYRIVLKLDSCYSSSRKFHEGIDLPIPGSVKDFLVLNRLCNKTIWFNITIPQL